MITIKPRFSKIATQFVTWNETRKMKPFHICVITFAIFVGCCEPIYINDLSLNFSFKRGTDPKVAECEQVGQLCDCDHLDQIFYCQDGGSVPSQVEKCDQSYCYQIEEYAEAECRKEKAPSCRNDGFVFQCSYSGQFPDPYDCRKYHLCVEESDKTMTDHPSDCPSGLNYNPRSGECEDIECRKPLSCPALAKNYSYDWNEKMYYTCIPNGPDQNDLIPVIFLCPTGVFDGARGACADEEISTTPDASSTEPSPSTEPTSSIEPTPSTELSSSEPTSTETNTVTESSTTGVTTDATTTLQYECEEKTLYPNETNCLHYIDCRTGVPIDRKCPTGNSFDPEKKKCVSGTDCLKSTTSSSSSSSTMTTTTTTTNTMTTDMSTNTTSLPSTPAVCSENTLFPNETNCLYYIDCRTGTPINRKCPVGESFDPERKRCVPGTECARTTVAPTKTTDARAAECADAVLADTKNCLYYFECRSGRIVKRKCPSGQSFSERHGRCAHGFEHCRR